MAPLLLSHPQLDSELLAEHVEAAAAGGRLPQGAQLAEQLLVRLGAHAARCRLLLRLGRVRQALVLAKRQRLVRQLAPEVLLEAAAATGDAVLLAAAQRVCREQASEGALPGPAEARGYQWHPGQLALA